LAGQQQYAKSPASPWAILHPQTAGRSQERSAATKRPTEVGRPTPQLPTLFSALSFHRRAVDADQSGKSSQVAAEAVAVAVAVAATRVLCLADVARTVRT